MLPTGRSFNAWVSVESSRAGPAGGLGYVPKAAGVASISSPTGCLASIRSSSKAIGIFRVSMDKVFYFERLYPLQDRILAVLTGVDTGFYLTGGTAASRGYLQHRLSDDLDFFVNDD